MKRAALKRRVGETRLPVCEALAFDAFDRGKSAVNVAVAERNAVIVAVIVFGKIPMQMFFFAVLVNAAHAAFED